MTDLFIDTDVIIDFLIDRKPGQTHNINSPCLFVSGSEVADQWGKKRLRIT